MSEHRFRAISTRYKGYNFRSRLEARWAVFFDHLNIRWDYEPEGFELGNGLRYLPDFWLPDWKIWIEVKPAACDDAAREKACRLVHQSGHALYMSNGLPDGPGTLFYLDASGVCTADARAAWAGSMPEFDGPGLYFAAYEHTVPTGDPIPHEHGAAMSLLSDGVPEDYPAPSHAGEFYAALDAARSSQFEFGAKGATV